MKYALVVLTHGRSPDLDRCLDAFDRWASPAPEQVRVYCDGPDEQDAVAMALAGRATWDWKWASTAAPRGFCVAVEQAWADVVACVMEPYTFWLEADFLLHRPLDLAGVADVLDAYPTLAQMALCRNAVAPHEIAAGGLVASRPGEFLDRSFTVYGDRDAPAGATGPAPLRATHKWMQQKSYFTTNPSLMRTSFMAGEPFLGDRPECEGRFGLELLERGYSFGLWGRGEVWVEHVGHRTGFGY